MYSMECLSQVMLRANENATTPEEDEPYYQGDQSILPVETKLESSLHNELNLVSVGGRRKDPGLSGRERSRLSSQGWEEKGSFSLTVKASGTGMNEVWVRL